MKDKSKRIAVIFLSILVAFGITLGAGVALANGEHEENDEHEITCWSSPRFPLAGEEAEVTCDVSHDGSPAEGLTVTLQLALAESDHQHGEASDDHAEAEADHPHDEAVADDHHDEAEADHPHDEAVADDHHDEAEADHSDGVAEAEIVPVEVVAIETAPGVYMAKYTFEEDGKYQATLDLGDEHAEFTVAVRSSPVAWPFLTGLAVVPLLLAGVVAVIKSVRRKW